MPKSQEKNYKNLYRDIKHLVGFKYDLRKKLTRGQKAAITRSYNRIVNLRGLSTDIVTFDKLKTPGGKKSKKIALNTIHKLKTKYGQQDTLISGLIINTYGMDVYIDDNGYLCADYKNPQGRARHVVWLPLDKKAFVKNPEQLILNTIAHYRPDEIGLLIGANMSLKYKRRISGKYRHLEIGAFLESIYKAMYQYNYTGADNILGDYFSGLYLVYYRKSKKPTKKRGKKYAKKKSK